jgi:glycosyltransferase involved in cell wall biosynthesis
MPPFSGNVLLLGNYLPDQQESMQRFARLLHDELARRGVAVEMIRPEPCFGRALPGSRGLAKWIGYLDKFVVFPSRLKRRLQRFKTGDILHICDHSNAVYTQAAADVPHLVTCHDFLAIRSALGEIPENPTRATGRGYQSMILTGLNNAQRVACVSEATRRDAQRLTRLDPKQITVVPNGLNYPYAPMPSAEARERIRKVLGKDPTSYILHVGGNQWYKNRVGAVRIYKRLLDVLPNAPDLLLVGKQPDDALRATINESGVATRIQILQGCENEDLRALYSEARALLFPSLMEGFGWPIVEAQACGCPVVTSNIAPMNEIAGHAAVFVDPRDTAAAARALCNLLAEDGSQRESRRQQSLANAARFSGARMIDRYIEEYETTVADFAA